MLREIASGGTWVSAHPDVTQKMGVKEVLHTTRHFGWGTDTQLYCSYQTSIRAEFPQRLHAGGPRVVKQNRGNGGQGVWKVQAVSGGLVSGWRRVAAASHERSRSMRSWPTVQLISKTADALSTSRFNSVSPVA